MKLQCLYPSLRRSQTANSLSCCLRYQCSDTTGPDSRLFLPRHKSPASATHLAGCTWSGIIFWCCAHNSWYSPPLHRSSYRCQGFGDHETLHVETLWTLALQHTFHLVYTALPDPVSRCLRQSSLLFPVGTAYAKSGIHWREHPFRFLRLSLISGVCWRILEARKHVIAKVKKTSLRTTCL
jgi:hypothetical protein